MISKRLAILMAGQKKQAKDPMVGKWLYTNYNAAYASTTGFLMPKKIDADTYFFQTNSTYQYMGGAIKQMGGIKATSVTGDVQTNRLLFCTNPYALAETYRLGQAAIGTSYIEFDDKAVDYFKSIGIYTELYVCLTMTHTKE